MANYTHVIWDFNGTVFDDVEGCFRTVNRILDLYGMKRLQRVEDYRQVFGFPIIDYYRRLGFDFERISYEDLAEKWMQLYLVNTRDAGVYPMFRETAEGIRKRGIRQSILSAMEQEMLGRYAKKLEIDGYMEELIGLGDICAHSKVCLATAWRQRNPLANVLFVGDTEHDFETAQELNADCVLVAQGHRPKEALLHCGAVEVIDSLAEFPWHLLDGGEKSGA